MISCAHWQLYVIIDRAAVSARDPVEVASAAIRGGADVIQLRDKTGSARQQLETARRLRPLTRAAGIPLIINDRADLAFASEADGIHLGQDDLPIQEVRRIVGPDTLIGKSTHSLDQALAAQAEGANYIGVGPIFPTPTKPDYGSVGTGLIEEVAARIELPFVCIGGIELGNVEQVVEAGARCVAVVRAVCAAENPESAARRLKRLLTQSSRSTAGHNL